MSLKYYIAKLIATSCFIGKIKYAPGSFGSLVAFPICYIIMYIVLNQQIVFHFLAGSLEEQQIMSLFIISLILIFILFWVGVYSTSVYITKLENKDPKEVVIDEVVGQMLVNIITSGGAILLYNSSIVSFFSENSFNIVFLFAIPFLFFRFFDIVKPWPIDWMDRNIKGAFGVMLDDIAAAIFAIVAYYVMVFLILDLFPKV